MQIDYGMLSPIISVAQWVGGFFAHSSSSADGSDEATLKRDKDGHRLAFLQHMRQLDDRQTACKCYYGEYPLSFAVCTNQGQLVAELLKAAAAAVEANDPLQQCVAQLDLLANVDTFGNNVLHLCAIYTLPDMYDYLCRIWSDLIDGEWPMKQHHDPASPGALALSGSLCLSFGCRRLDSRSCTDAEEYELKKSKAVKKTKLLHAAIVVTGSGLQTELSSELGCDPNARDTGTL